MCIVETSMDIWMTANAPLISTDTCSSSFPPSPRAQQDYLQRIVLMSTFSQEPMHNTLQSPTNSRLATVAPDTRCGHWLRCPVQRAGAPAPAGRSTDAYHHPCNKKRLHLIYCDECSWTAWKQGECAFGTGVWVLHLLRTGLSRDRRGGVLERPRRGGL